MRALLRDTAVTFGGALLIVCMTLGTVEIPGSETGWAGRTWQLLVKVVKFDFHDINMRTDPVTAVASGSLVTAKIVLATALFLVLIAVPIGILSVTHRESGALRVVRRIVEGASSFPVLFWCAVAAIVVARILHGDPGGPKATLYAIVVLLLGDRLLAELIQRVEIGTKEVLSQPYMRTVRAGGFGVQRHVLQSLAGPIAATLLSRAMFLISGAIVAERVFGLSGLGASIFGSISRDNPQPAIALLASIALLGFGVVFRLAHWSTLTLADARTRAR